jgi:hypothetical protein
MLLEALQRRQLFLLLHIIDVREAAAAQARGCAWCGGRLHQASFPRKPRGGPNDLPEDYARRLGLCCDRDGCRRRVLPPSVLFWDRRVYWGVVLVVITALRQQRPEGFAVGQLEKRLKVPRQTLARWMRYFREVFPQSRRWQRLRGRVHPGIGAEELPSVLLERFLSVVDPVEQALERCLCFLRLDAG